MNVVFKQCLSENEKINKSFSSNTATFDVEYKDTSSVFNPVIIIGTSSDLTQYNYCDIADLSRKYFITDIEMLRANLYRITLHVDVLSTYADEILVLPAVTKRQENNYNKYITDEAIPLQNKEDIIVKASGGSGFSKNLQYVLTVAG